MPLGLPPLTGHHGPRTSPVGPTGTIGRFAGNVAGEKGFDGITADIKPVPRPGLPPGRSSWMH